MSDREFENYLALLGGMLRLRRTQRESIAGELRDHLIEHVAHLEASGIAHEEAVRRALEEFGDAAALAANFSALVGMRRRRLIMRCTIGTTVVMTGLVVAMLAFRPEVADDPNVAQAQAESEPREHNQPDHVQTRTAPPAYSKERTRQTDDGPRDPDQRARLILKEPIDVEFTETPLQTALEFLSDKLRVQHYIDKRSFRDAGVNEDAVVTLNLSGVPLDMVLDIMFRELGLGYRVRNGVIVVASEDYVQSQTEVRVYRVPDGMGMAEELAALIPATIDHQTWREHLVLVDPRGRRRSGYGAGYGRAEGGGYGSAGGGYGRAVAAEGESAEVVGGGGAGTIRVFRGTLVISQTPEVHQKIEKLLADLERAGAMESQRRFGEGDRGGYGRPLPGIAPGLTPPRTGIPSTFDPAQELRPNTPPTFERPLGSEAPDSPRAGAPADR